MPLPVSAATITSVPVSICGMDAACEAQSDVQLRPIHIIYKSEKGRKIKNNWSPRNVVHSK